MGCTNPLEKSSDETHSTTLASTSIESSEPKPETTTSAPATTSSSSSSTTTSTSLTTELGPGDTARINYLELEFDSFKETDTFVYYDTKNSQQYRLKAPPEKSFLIINAKIRNLEEVGIFSPNLNITRFMLRDSAGNLYSPDRFEGADMMPLSKTLNAKNEMGGRVIYKIPKDAVGLKLVYDFSGLGEGAGQVTWAIR